MPGPLYDDALATLDDQEDPRQPQQNIYLDTLEDIDRGLQRNLKVARQQTKDDTPQRAAHASRIAREVGLAPALALRH